MKYIYKITGKVSLILYIFMLYQFWHLCQYGGLRRHIPMLALGIIGLVGTVVLWLISKRHNQGSEYVNNCGHGCGHQLIGTGEDSKPQHL